MLNWPRRKASELGLGLELGLALGLRSAWLISLLSLSLCASPQGLDLYFRVAKVLMLILTITLTIKVPRLRLSIPR